MPLDWLKKSTSPPPGRGTGRDGRPVVNTDSPSAGLKSDKELDGKLVVQRRHVDWLEHQIRWRWLLDSFEGGRPLPQRGVRPGPPRLAGAEPVPAQARVPRPADVPQRLPGIRRVPRERQRTDAGRRLRALSRHDRSRPGRDGAGRRLRVPPQPDAGPRVRRRGRRDPPGQGIRPGGRRGTGPTT